MFDELYRAEKEKGCRKSRIVFRLPLFHFKKQEITLCCWI
ncbi:hypothetical protein B4121_2786 [Bacillus paralicheniformis]|uniref:Uncharacterized protein n=1 Tax=Bacillus paralicheniformis TaxID=1648923 RepID=A0A7Z1B3D4_9BACI|nr:hypothetical protein B4121_2786 [Bacillus paralicheniformis]TWJ42430.1 hypothetical protein CHCC5027_4250 [Bacillus paralicheniformis]